MKSLSHWGMFPCWELPELRRTLEKIAGMREYDPQDYEAAAIYKPQDGMWTVDEYLADTTLRQPGLPPMVEQPKSWVHVPIGSPYPITNYTLAEALTPHEDDLKLTIVKT